MTENAPHAPGGTQRCGFVWCTTRHGETSHPDDEAHRSAGVGFSARVRGVGEEGTGVEREIEIGILRRPDDEDAWLVIEVGQGGLALSRDGAHQLRRALVTDPLLRQALTHSPE